MPYVFVHKLRLSKRYGITIRIITRSNFDYKKEVAPIVEKQASEFYLDFN
jgi:hypothetical protein